MKRDLPSSSKDSYKPPNPTKKNSTLDIFLKIEKPDKVNSSLENITNPAQQKISKSSERKNSLEITNNSVLEEYFSIRAKKQSKNDFLDQKMNSNSFEMVNSNSFGKKDKPNSSIHKESHQVEKVSNRESEMEKPYFEVPMSPDEAEYLMKTYLNNDFDYACEKCLQDITNYTKLKVDDKIYCVGCAAEVVTTEYTIIRALHDESLIDFSHQKQYGLESYDLIKNHMKTDHPIEEIKFQQQHFIQKFLSSQQGQKIVQDSAASHSMNIEIDIDPSDENQIKEMNERLSCQCYKNQRNQKLLKILKYNEKRDEFEYEKSPGFFQLIASQITKEDLKNHPEDVEIIWKGRQNEKMRNQIQEKILKKKLLQKCGCLENGQHMKEKEHEMKKSNSKNGNENEKNDDKDDQKYKNEGDDDDNDNGENNYEDGEICDDEICDDESDDDSQEDDDADQNNFMSENDNLPEKEKQKLLKSELIIKYNILNPDQNVTLQRVVRRLLLIDRKNILTAQGLKQVKRRKAELCKKLNIPHMTGKKFNSYLTDDEVKTIFKLDQIDMINAELKKINDSTLQSRKIDSQT